MFTAWLYTASFLWISKLPVKGSPGRRTDHSGSIEVSPDPPLCIGTRKLVVLLHGFVKDHHIALGRDALFDLLRAHDLLIRKRSQKVKTTMSRHWLQKYPDHIKDFVPLAPNQVWAGDITYIVLSEGRFAYLSLVTDLYSRKILGFHLSETLEATGCVAALGMAMKTTKCFGSLIHHSDRVQYCSHEYVRLLENKHIKISMTQSGDPLENAIAERVDGILKAEYLQEKYDDFKKAQTSITKAVTIYNSLRPHSSCEMKTRDEAHQSKGSLKRRWKNYYKKKEVTVPA